MKKLGKTKPRSVEKYLMLGGSVEKHYLQELPKKCQCNKETLDKAKDHLCPLDLDQDQLQNQKYQKHI